MAGRLRSSVVVRHPELGVKILPAGSVLPDWAAGLVSGRLLLVEGSVAEALTGQPTQPVPPSTDDGNPPEPKSTELPPVTAPPRAGRGSGLEPWRSYAEFLAIEVPDDAQRDDVIELVDQHNQK